MVPVNVSRSNQQANGVNAERDEGLQRRNAGGPGRAEPTFSRWLEVAYDYNLRRETTDNVREALERAEFQHNVVCLLHGLAVKLRALTKSSCDDRRQPGEDWGDLEDRFCVLLDHFERSGELAAQQKEELASDSVSLVGGRPDALHAQGCADGLKSALEGTHQTCASLAGISIADVMEAKRALERLDETLEALAEIRAATRAVRSVLKQRALSLKNASPALADAVGCPPTPMVGLPIAALARPPVHR